MAPAKAFHERVRIGEVTGPDVGAAARELGQPRRVAGHEDDLGRVDAVEDGLGYDRPSCPDAPVMTMLMSPRR